MFNSNGNWVKDFPSFASAARELRVAKSNISEVISGKQNVVKGFRFKLKEAIGAAALLLFSICVQAQIIPPPSQGYAVRYNRVIPDSVLYLPTACGVPTDSTFLFSQGFSGNGGKAAKGAIYYDSCGHHGYFWDPATKSWALVGSGGGGADSGISVILAPLSGVPLQKIVIGGTIYIVGDTSVGNPGAIVTRAGSRKFLDSLGLILGAKFGLTDTGYTHLLASVYLLQKVNDSMKIVNVARYRQLSDSNTTVNSTASIGRLNKATDSIRSALGALIAQNLLSTDSNQTIHSWASIGRLNKIADSMAGIFLRQADSNQTIHSWASIGRLNKIADSLGALIAGGGGGMTNPMTTLNDIIIGGSGGTPQRLGAGGTNTVFHGNGTYGTVANADLSPMAANTIKINNTGGSASPIDGTPANVAAMLPTFTSSAKGLVPPPGGSPSGTNALLDNGTWGVTSGGIDSVRRLSGTDTVNQYKGGVASFAYRDTTLGLKTVKSGIVAIDSSQKMGDIYNKTSWANLSDFTNVGTNFSVSGGKIFTSNFSTGSGVIEFPNATMLDQETVRVDFKYLTKSSADFGFAIYWNSIGNPSQSKADLAFELVIHTGTTNQLNIVSVVNGTATNNLSGSTLSGGVSVGDALTYIVTHTPSGYVFQCINNTTGQSITYALATNYTYPGGGVEHNTAKLQLYAQLTASTVEIDKIQWSSNQPINAQLMLRGNSIGNRSFSQSPTAGYVDLIHATNESGPGDVTSAYLATEAEIIAQHPKNIFIDYTGNDTAFHIPTATTRANLTTFYNDLTAAGINCYFLSTTPRNAVDVTGNLTWLNSNFTGRVIDCTTPLLGSGSGLNILYDAGDGTHLNGAGHAAKASLIIANPIYQALANNVIVEYVADPGLDSTKTLALANVGYVERRLGGGVGGGIAGSLTATKVPVADGPAHVKDGPIVVSGSNVGVGVTPSYLFDLGGNLTGGAHFRFGDIYGQSFNSGNNFFAHNIQNVSGAYKFVNTGVGQLLNFDAGGVFIGGAASGSAGTSPSFTLGEYITNGGHTLFGTVTDSGTATVQVNGNVKIKADSVSSPNGGYVTRNKATGVLELTAGPNSGFAGPAYTLWSDTAAVGTAVTNIIASQSLLTGTSGFGSVSLPGTLTPGTIYHIHAILKVSTASSPGGLLFFAGINGSGGSFSAPGPTGSLSGVTWVLDARVMIYSTTSFLTDYQIITDAGTAKFSSLSTTTFTPGTNTIGLYAEWSTVASSSNSIQLMQGSYIEKL